MRWLVSSALVLGSIGCAEPEAVVLRGESIGSCSYVSSFSGEPECRDFHDADAADAEAHCADDGATFEAGVVCDVEEVLGTCTYESDGMQIRTTVEGTDASTCGSNRFGCETFAGGVWEPAANCDGTDELVVLDDPWPWPELVCVDPLEGEPVGESDGQVCTWQVVSGATEAGRHFSDYAECDVIRRQRPYSSVPANDLADEPDSRMDDPTFAAEVDWTRSQLRAGSCECCHSQLAPEGPAVFDADFEGNWANQMSDRGLAIGASWVPTVGFGTYPAEENNGFARNSAEHPEYSAFPSTDPARLVAFFEGELAHRGLTRDDFDGDSFGAGPLDEQLYYEPEACTPDEGIDADGVIRWAPGRARFVYVLEKESASPTVPPNLDTPAGTLWRIDLPPDGSPVRSETITYGVVPDGMVQTWPADGSAPPPLEQGKEYYLYVTADVMFPISRCEFVAGEAAPAEEAAGCNAGGASVGLGAGLLALGAALRRRA